MTTTESAYRAGDAGFSDLVDAQRVLLEFELAHERAAADHAGALARIRALVGAIADGWRPGGSGRVGNDEPTELPSERWISETGPKP